MNFEFYATLLTLTKKRSETRLLARIELHWLICRFRMRFNNFSFIDYINFYFINGGIIMPIFGGIHENTDKKAVEIIKRTFPDRKVITVNGMPIIRGGGNIHCITQQVPLGFPAKLKP